MGIKPNELIYSSEIEALNGAMLRFFDTDIGRTKITSVARKHCDCHTVWSVQLRDDEFTFVTETVDYHNNGDLFGATWYGYCNSTDKYTFMEWFDDEYGAYYDCPDEVE